MRNKKIWSKNIITAVISFAMILGIFTNMQMKVNAADHTFNTTVQDDMNKAQATIYHSGDTLTFTNIPSVCIILYQYRWDIYDNNDNNVASILNYHSMGYPFTTEYSKSFSFPDHIQADGKNYMNPQYQLRSVPSFTTSGSSSSVYVITLVFKVYGYDSVSPVSSPDSPVASESTVAPSHECNFQWVTTIEPQPGVDGLEEYKCMSCGMVKESQPIPASMATVKNLYGFIKDAPENGAVTTDFGKLHTISDYLLKKMSERNDVTATIQFEYNNTKLQITFPAGTDYTPVLTDTDTMYGFYGVAAKLGLTVTER